LIGVALFLQRATVNAMKILAMIVIAGMGGTAWGRNIDMLPGTRVSVCVVGESSTITLLQAENLGSRMFAAADLTIEWRNGNDCPADGIRVVLFQAAQESDDRSTLGYALPYEGNHVVLFWDRIATAANRLTFPFLLGHVLVHEVTHILEGVTHHSDTGVMKAKFAPADIDAMVVHPLPFTEADLQLIQLGMIFRRTRLAQTAGRNAAAGLSEAGHAH
jgi:hypothetical protein